MAEALGKSKPGVGGESETGWDQPAEEKHLGPQLNRRPDPVPLPYLSGASGLSLEMHPSL
jgi:hypothetical protein